MCFWNEELYNRVNSTFHNMISYCNATKGKCNIEWAHGNRALVAWNGTLSNKNGGLLLNYTHCFYTILNCCLEDDENAFLCEVAAHRYTATTSDEAYDLIPPFTWTGWEERKRQREIEDQLRRQQLQEDERRKEETQRQQWMREGRCSYCGGYFEAIKVGLFAKEWRCNKCHKKKSYN